LRPHWCVGNRTETPSAADIPAIGLTPVIFSGVLPLAFSAHSLLYQSAKDLVNSRRKLSEPNAAKLSALEKGWCKMLSWAITFLVIALIAAVLGFGGIAGTASSIAQVLFFVFLVLFIISLIIPRVRPPVA